MNANEKAQRLALVTNKKFKLNERGDITESDLEITKAELDEAMDMPESEYNERIESQRRDNIVAQLRLDYVMQAAYAAYQSANGSGTFDGFARLAVDAVENAREAEEV